MRVGVAFGICLLLFGLSGDDRGLQAVLKARRDARALATSIETLRAQNAALRAAAAALRDDPTAIEDAARRTLGMARAGELVVVRR